MWFEDLTGFKEESPEQVRSLIEVNEKTLTSKVNHRSYHFGSLAVSSLGELKKAAPSIHDFDGQLSLSEVVGDVQLFHVSPDNKNALFQAASQFNLLEMVNPEVTPEQGIGRYDFDKTQGPACAIACGAGTIYRNYFAPVNDQIGQTDQHQIDCLQDIGDELNNNELGLWQMKNGYALISEGGLINISVQLKNKSKTAYEQLKEKLQIGIQWDTQVTLAPQEGQRVSQVYCSALPVAYSPIDVHYWEPFARFILEATYEATLYVALLNYQKTGNKKVFLTLVGGGAFGNKTSWIMDAISHAIKLFSKVPLDVKIVSYGQSNAAVKQMIEAKTNAN